MENEIFKEEQARLEQVVTYIDRLLWSETPREEKMRQEILDERRRIWDDYSHRPDDTELMQANQTLDLDTERYFRVRDSLYALHKIRSSPYFARIDFCLEGDTVSEPIYIGTVSLVDADTYEVLICDWRADIASLFYDATIGPCSYESTEGTVKGSVTLRRQICVEDGTLKYAFDTALNITDPVLMEELGKNSDAKLKSIVTTIQKEQNRIIRNVDADLLLVRGSAGSGKTSVALHRLAFLLYRNRNQLSSQNVVIFSPSEVFSAYIADVLPELGEETAIRSDFYHYFSGYDETKRFCDRGEQTEALLATDSVAFREMIEDKGSLSFAEELKKYFISRYETHLVEGNLTGFGNEIIASNEELKQWFFIDYAGYKPYVRVQKIAMRAVSAAEEQKEAILKSFLEEATQHGVISLDEEERKAEGDAMWSSAVQQLEERVSDLFLIPEEQIYLDFLSQHRPQYYAHTKALLDEKVVAYEDLFPLAWLRFLCGKVKEDRSVRQIVIDEAQDAPLIVFLLLAQIFTKARFTVLGDPAQQIGGAPFSMEQIAACFPQMKSVVSCSLEKSYRSTIEINEFASQFRNGKEERTVERSGIPPEIVQEDDVSLQIPRILEEYQKRGHKTNLILCRTQVECDRLYEKLMHKVPVVRLRSFDSFSAGTTAILPAYLSKGLEADGVIIYGVSDQWNKPEDRAMLYVAATRAMHELTVIRSSDPCPILDY